VLRRLAGAVLHDLTGVGDLRAETAAVAEMPLDHLRLPPGDDADLADARGEQTFEDVLEDRAPLDGQHRFRQLVGELPHPGAFACCEDDGFHAARIEAASRR